VSLIKAPSGVQTGVITVAVPKEAVTSGSGFTFPIPAQIVNTVSGDAPPVTVASTTGQAIPSWLQFNAETKVFIATAVPAGGLPYEVVITVGGVSSTMLISENAQ
jgi:hypothetical protein